MDKMVKESLFNGFYKSRRVLITGHTGFKGSWLSMILNWLGADVYGYSLKPRTNPSLYELAGIDEMVTSTIGDIRDYAFLSETLNRVKPDIIIHMAAQALVKDSYKNPRETYEINVMGTVNLLDAARYVQGIKAILNITTDKCYENKEWYWGYRENEPMGGYDPYSNSKACSELITSSFRNSFFNPVEYSKHGVALASARAGNVIGGGDWAEDRLIPDFIRAILSDKKVSIRYPESVRPWQHVLEPLTGYLILCEKLFNEGPAFGEAWNFGSDDNDAKNVQWIMNKISQLWPVQDSYELDKNQNPHEAGYLKLDCSKARTRLGWYPRLNIETALKMVIDWTKAYKNHDNVSKICLSQIEEYYL